MSLTIREVVEVDASTGALSFATLFISSPEDFTGTRIGVSFKEGVGLVGCWPSWPEFMEGLTAAWTAKAYARRFKGEVLYCFGLRLDLSGRLSVPFRVEEWRVSSGVFSLRVLEAQGFRAVVGPFRSQPSVLTQSGKIEWAGEEAKYLMAEPDPGGTVNLKAALTSRQPFLSGFLEGKVEVDELPVKPLLPSRVTARLIARLPDLRYQ